MFIRIPRPNGSVAWINMDYAALIEELTNTDSPSLRIVVGDRTEVVNDKEHGVGMVASIIKWLGEDDRSFSPQAEIVVRPEAKRREPKRELQPA